MRPTRSLLLASEFNASVVTARSSVVVVLALGLACGLFVCCGAQQPGPDNQTPVPKPPRGYCVRISRAVPESSRCFKHLIDQVAGPATGRAANKHDELAAADDDGRRLGHPKGASNLNSDPNHNNIKEELVYVRLETLGSNLSDLSTQVINERILLGILDQLLYGPEEAPIDNIKVEGNNNNNNNDGMKNLIPSQLQASKATTSSNSSGLDGARKSRTQLQTEPQPQPSPSPPPPPPPSGTHMGAGNLNYYDGLKRTSFGGDAPTDGPEKLAEKCRLSMEKFLCRLVYPSCHFRRTDVSALVRPPCREDCLLLRDSLCPNLNWPKFTWALNSAFNVTLMSTINVLDLAVEGDPQAKQDLIIGAHSSISSSNHIENQESHSATGAKVDHLSGKRMNKNRYDGLLNSSIHFYWPHEHSIASCESLPPLLSPFHTTSGNLYHAHEEALQGASKFDLSKRQGPRRPVCSNAHLTKTIALSSREQSVLDTKTGPNECLNSPDGADYEGKLNHTNTLIPCQSWASQWPHSHKSSELLFDNMRRAHNYCRNPGGLELKPWCYTMDPKVRWQFCDIKQC